MSGNGPTALLIEAGPGGVRVTAPNGQSVVLAPALAAQVGRELRAAAIEAQAHPSRSRLVD